MTYANAARGAVSDRTADSFIFRLTSICDKHCMLCCNNYDEIKTAKSAALEDLRSRLAEIRDYRAETDGCASRPYVFLTGGEAFLYRAPGRGRAETLFDVIQAVNSAIPEAGIVVKTGGFRQANSFQCALFDRIADMYASPLIEFRLGFNRYQDSEEEALDRFVSTVERVLAYQHYIAIDTIYDKTNLRDTCGTLEEGLRQVGIGIRKNRLLEMVLADPNDHRRIGIQASEDSIVLDLGPAYPPNEAATVHEYYSEPSSDCDTIGAGTSALYYDTDMGLIHCNDSFVDARVAPLRLQPRSIASELAFLNARFRQLSVNFAERRTRFQSRQERCFFCTGFVMAAASE